MNAVTQHVDRLAIATVALERIGWKLAAADVDLVSMKVRVELERSDGLLVTLDASEGRGSITREMKRVRVESIGAGGCIASGGGFPQERIRIHLLGRQRVSGIRSGMRTLANYVADNSPQHDRTLTRNVFRGLLT